MYLKCSKRRKNGKEHRSWSIVENRRVPGGQSVQRHVLYLGEINDSQQAAWEKSITVFAEGQSEPQQVALFPEDRVGVGQTVPQIQLKLSELSLHRPRQWGACWLRARPGAGTGPGGPRRGGGAGGSGTAGRRGSAGRRRRDDADRSRRPGVG